MHEDKNILDTCCKSLSWQQLQCWLHLYMLISWQGSTFIARVYETFTCPYSVCLQLVFHGYRTFLSNGRKVGLRNIHECVLYSENYGSGSGRQTTLWIEAQSKPRNLSFCFVNACLLDCTVFRPYYILKILCWNFRNLIFIFTPE